MGSLCESKAIWVGVAGRFHVNKRVLWGYCMVMHSMLGLVIDGWMWRESVLELGEGLAWICTENVKNLV